MENGAVLAEWQQMIRTATRESAPIEIHGGRSKRDYGHRRNRPSRAIDTRAWSGVVDYAPEEMVVTARAGTGLAELEQALAEQGQMLPFEPPHFAGGATLGGCVAAGLSGPARAYQGSVRDSVLGIRMLDGQGRMLRFGGQVIKNVAGFDVARFLVGSLGTLGLITEVSLKLAPQPREVQTLVLAVTPLQALERLAAWRRAPVPVTASAWVGGMLHVRLAGDPAFVQLQATALGGARSSRTEADGFWNAVRDHRHAFFANRPGHALLRLSVRADAPPSEPEHESLIEWGGAVRWVWAEDSAIARLREWAQQHGGHATLFRASAELLDRHCAFAPLPAAHMALMARIKSIFDPSGIFNPGRMYPSL